MVHQDHQTHFLLVTFPSQGHINPTLEFSKRLIAIGARVTFVTSVFAHRGILKKAEKYPADFIFAPFSDGYDDGFKRTNDVDAEHYMTEFRHRSTEAISNIIENSAKGGCPITCLIYTLLLPWAAEVVHKFQLSSALLWIQPATVFDILYYYLSGSKGLILDNIDDPSYAVQLPGLPLLKALDLPTFLLPSSPNSLAIKMFQDQFDSFSQEAKPFRILANTFDELEPEALKSIDKFNLIGIGPLIPSNFLNSTGPSGKSVERDFLSFSTDYMEWLNSKDKVSVVYVSFGTIVVLSNKQMEEIARGLVDSKRPFLWVIRSGECGHQQDKNETYSDILREEHRGMVVPWCSQVEVLNHPSVGCFVSHCGWNSTLETLAMGVPVVAFPQRMEQGTNAKLIEDVWKIGVRVKTNEDKLVRSEEIIRCLEEVFEGKGNELRANAKKWQVLSRGAIKEGGSSDRNLRAFVEEAGQISL